MNVELNNFQKLQDVLDMTEHEKDVFDSLQSQEKKVDAKKRYEKHQTLTKEEYIYNLLQIIPRALALWDVEYIREEKEEDDRKRKSKNGKSGGRF